MEHPITPLPELVMEWVNNHYGGKVHRDLGGVELSIATRAAQWGADQELEACCETLHQRDCAYLLPSQLRAARRPKPPSLKEQALNLITNHECIGSILMTDDIKTIRLALEALPND
jgi:hypothetical protein